MMGGTTLNRLGAALKAAGAALSGAIRFPTSTRYSWSTLGATSQDFRKSVGDPASSSMLVAAVQWMTRTYPEAPMVVRKRNSDGDEPTKLHDHPLARLLATPNPEYSGLLLWGATIADFVFSNTGTAYWRKVRSASRAVVELWWTPSWMLTPRWPEDGSRLISHYDYRVDGTIYQIPREDIVAFPNGINPQNMREGNNTVASLMREIGTDNEAANWVISILRNMGLPGAFIAPNGPATLSSDDAEEIKQLYLQKFTGDRRGEPMVMESDTSVTQMGFDAKQLDLKELRRIPEERVSAVLGIPAIVLGYGAGLDRSTFANMAEARQQAYEGNVIPTQRLFAAQVQAQLVSDFGDPATLFVEHDYSDVRVLQDDVNALHARAREDLLAGGITMNRFLAMIGEKALPDQNGDVIYMPVNVTPMLVTDLLALRENPARVTVPDPGADVPEPTTDPGQAPPKPADPGAIITPTGEANAPKSARVRQLVEAQFDAALADAVLKVLGDDHEGVSAAEHAETVIREAQRIARAGR